MKIALAAVLGFTGDREMEFKLGNALDRDKERRRIMMEKVSERRGKLTTNLRSWVWACMGKKRIAAGTAISEHARKFTTYVPSRLLTEDEIKEKYMGKQWLFDVVSFL